MTPQLLTGVVTQGRAGVNSYVTSYMVLYSGDGYSWTPYQDGSGNQVQYYLNTSALLKSSLIYSCAMGANTASLSVISCFCFVRKIKSWQGCKIWKMLIILAKGWVKVRKMLYKIVKC